VAALRLGCFREKSRGLGGPDGPLPGTHHRHRHGAPGGRSGRPSAAAPADRRNAHGGTQGGNGRRIPHRQPVFGLQGRNQRPGPPGSAVHGGLADYRSLHDPAGGQRHPGWLSQRPSPHGHEHRHRRHVPGFYPQPGPLHSPLHGHLVFPGPGAVQPHAALGRLQGQFPRLLEKSGAFPGVWHHLRRTRLRGRPAHGPGFPGPGTGHVRRPLCFLPGYFPRLLIVSSCKP